MRYVEYTPCTHLAPVVERYWILEGPGSGLPEPVVPDGRIELIFHYGTPFVRHHDNGRVETQPAAIVAGQITGPVVLSHRLPAGVAAIRLRPAAARAVLGIPASELTGRIEAAAQIFADAPLLGEQLAEAGCDVARIAVLEAWLLAHVRADPRSDVNAAVATIVNSGGTVSIERLAALTGLGRRQLERAFRQEVGLTPKALGRIVRFQRAVRLVRRGRSLSDVAAACGFYDQAHMAFDFRRLALGPPSDWQQRDYEIGVLLAGG
jgi:AraC-like DNA-binding protein